LIRKNTMFAAMEFSRCARTASARRPPQTGGLSKLNSVARRGRRNSRRAQTSDDRQRSSTVTASQPRCGCLAANDELDAYGSKSSRIP
jgi:hypothetical protein